MTDEPASVWVASDRTHTDTYVCTVHPTPDLSIPLRGQHTTDYALEVIRVCEIADYEAAIVAMMTAIGDPGKGLAAAAAAIVEMRERHRLHRRTRPNAATGELTFTGLVSERDRRPYVHVILNGQVIAQWTTDEARGHAMHVLRVATAAVLDQIYLDVLAGPVGLTRPDGRSTVDLLRMYRQAVD